MGMMNRLLVILLSLSLMAVSVMFLHAPQVAIAALERALSLLRADPDPVRLGAAVAAAIAALLFLLELLPRRRMRFEAVAESGTIEYPETVIQQMIERELMAMDGVRDVHTRIGGDRHKAEVRASLFVDLGQDSHDMAARAGVRIRERLGHLGLGVGAVRLSVQGQAGGEEAPAHRAA